MSTRTFTFPVVSAGPTWPSAGRFADVSTNTPSDVDPCPSRTCVYSGSTGQNTVFDAWQSGVFAPEFGSQGSYVVWGGGHTNYYGNEVYRFDLASKQWSRLTAPSLYWSGAGNVNLNASTGAFPDGNPCPPHSYQTFGMLSSANGGGPNGSLISATLPFCGGSATTYPAWWKFDLSALTWSVWRTGGNPTAGPTLMVQEPGSHFWDFRNNRPTSTIYRVTQGGVVTAYSGQDLWSSNDAYWTGAAAGRYIVILSGAANGQYIYVLNLTGIESAGAMNASNTKSVNVPTSATTHIHGLTWCADKGAFACYSSAGVIRWLTPSNPADLWSSTWSWVSETLTGSVAAHAPSGNGDFSRFVWVNSLKCFLHISANTQYMQAFHPAGV